MFNNLQSFYNNSIIIYCILFLNINTINSMWIPKSSEQKPFQIFDAKVENENYNEISSNVNITSSSSTLVTTSTTTAKPSGSGNESKQIWPRNNLIIGSCKPTDQRVYTDNTIIENDGPSTLNGTMEIYIDSPIRITCIKVEDQITDGTGALPSLHSGGIGFNWVHINVLGKYGKGFHFKIHVFGELNVKLEKELKSI